MGSELMMEILNFIIEKLWFIPIAFVIGASLIDVFAILDEKEEPHP